MSRLKADLLLLLVAIIWGGAFVAQKTSYGSIGPCAFVAARFTISFLLVLPLAWRERARAKEALAARETLFLCLAFCAGALLQQLGVGKTSVTNAGFLTGLYVLFVPLIGWLFYRHRPSPWIVLACLMSVAGVWLLCGGALQGIGPGDALVFACAVSFGAQIVLLGRAMSRVRAPLVLSCLQYAAVALAAGVGAFAFETVTLEALRAALMPILYAGVISGGIAFTLQAVAQQYTPPSDSAVIMSGEAGFAAVSAAWFLGERLLPLQYAGCALIFAAILLTELLPLWLRARISSKPAR